MKGVIRVGAVLLGIALFAVASARADTIEYEYSISGKKDNFSTGFTLPAFDPSQGILTQVEVTLESDLDCSVQLFQTANGPVSYSNAAADMPVELEGPGFTIKQDDPSGPFSGTLTGSSGSTTTLPATHGTASDSTLDSTPASVAGFEGTGTVNFTYESDDSFYSFGGGGPSVVVEGTQTATGSGTLIYTFTPTPEPSCLALLGLGVLVRRRGGRR